MQWTELDRILQLDAGTNGVARAPSSWTTWTDAWGVYDDVCLVCVTLCSGLWRSSSSNSNGTSGLRDQWSWAGSPRERSRRRAHVRAHGDGIEGRPTSLRLRAAAAHDDVGKYDSDSSGGGDDEGGEEDQDGAVLVRSRQAHTTLALLQTFHAQTRFLLSRLATVLPPSASALSDHAQLTPRDLLVLALGPLSSLDARFVEWLAEEYAGGATCLAGSWVPPSAGRACPRRRVVHERTRHVLFECTARDGRMDDSWYYTDRMVLLNVHTILVALSIYLSLCLCRRLLYLSI